MKLQDDLNTAVFKKSTYSNGGDNCIEAAAAPGTAAFRDTKDRSRGMVAVSASAWDAFVTHAKNHNI